MRFTKLAARARIFVGGTPDQNQVPATRPSDTMLVGTGTRMVPTVYEELKAQRRRRFVLMALWIALPTLIASVYYGLIASGRYVSEAKMVISQQSSGPGAAGGGALAGKSTLLSMVGMAGGGGGDSGQGYENAIVSDYLQSTQAMDAADRAIGLRRIWSGSAADYFSRLHTPASEEEFYKYYSNHVTVISDPLDPVIQLKVEAFRPEEAQLIGKTLVSLSQEKLNSSFTAMREDSLQFARSEVTRAEKQLATANDKLRVYRNAHAELDPAASAQGVGSVTTALFGQLASSEAELHTLMSYAREDSSAVKNLKTRIASLKKQISDNRSMLAGTNAGPGTGDQKEKQPYSELMSNYEELILNQKFAQESYTSAMSFLAQSRASVARQHSYLVDFLSPTLPEEALEPRSIRNIFTVLLASGLLWLTISLVGSALREHARR